MPKLVAGCLVLAGLSLLLPSQPSYDPWAWLVWGRELWHGTLDTGGGPSWKPLPVAFTFAFAPAGELAPMLWLVVARASGLLALALAFRLAARLAGPRRLAGIVAGTVAAVALALVPLWLRYLAHGNEAPMAVALMLFAFERHLDGRRGHAFAAGAVACLLRPELFPFVALHGLWVAWHARPWARVAIVGSLVAVPALWIVPEWIGSGHPLDGGRQATSEPFWSLSLEERPWLAALERAHRETGLALELGALLAVALSIRERRAAVLAPAGAAVLWLGMYVAMTQLGFSGNARYVLPALVVICVLAGVGAGRLAAVAPKPALAAAAAALIAIAAAPFLDRRVGQACAEGRLIEQRTALHRDLSEAVRRLGGPGGVNRYSAATVNRAFETHLAWDLKLPVRTVERARARGLVFGSEWRVTEPRPLPRRVAVRALRARVGGWRVFAPPRLSRAFHMFCMGNNPATMGARLRRCPRPNWSAFPHDHRSRIPGSRQREHDPPDHRRRPRRRGGHGQALLEPHPQVPANQEGRARDDGQDGQDGHVRRAGRLRLSRS